jgi:glutamate synthase (NADPH/NADH) small chain
MGKQTGFMEYPREVAERRPVFERVQDFFEIYVDMPGEGLVRQGARCMDCGVPFCHSGCPLNNLIPDWNDLVYRDRWREASRALHATNNFPEFTGRLCPAPCESSCVLGINESPVTIKQIERAIIDRAWREGWVQPQPAAVKTGKRVAIVGSGPAGLAAAQQLARAGHDVTVFEKADRIGGLLRYGIPDFKLEKHLIDRRIEQMAAEGVVFRTGAHVGVSVAIDELRKTFDAILLAGGAEQPRDLNVPGRELAGIHFALDFLPQQNRRCAGDRIEPALAGPGAPPPGGRAEAQIHRRAGPALAGPGAPPPGGRAEAQIHRRAGPRGAILATGKRVVIIGGGDTGADCLGTCHRQHALSVHQFEILPQPPAERSPETPWPLWPMQLRVESSHEEGGVRDWAIATTRFEGDASGNVERLHGVRVGPPPAFEPLPGSEFTMEVDLVLLAMGFTGPARGGLLEQLDPKLDGRGNIACDADYMSSVPGVFAAGDMRRGQSLIVWAIAEGRKAAHAMNRHLVLPGAK